MVLYALGYVASLIVGMDDKARGSDIGFVAPCLYIAEAYELIAQFCLLAGVEGEDSFAFSHLCGHIFVCALSYTCASFLGCLAYCVEYKVYVFLVASISHYNFYSVFVCHCRVYFNVGYISMQSIYQCRVYFRVYINVEYISLLAACIYRSY